MIRKLRNKIIVINVVLMGIILLTALITVYAIGFNRIRNESDARLSTALNYIPTDGSFDENPLFKDVTLIIYDSDSKQLIQFYNNASLNVPTDEIVGHLRNIVHQSDSGFYLPLRCYYKYRYEGNLFKLALLDVQQNSIATYSVISIITCKKSLKCYFVIRYL